MKGGDVQQYHFPEVQARREREAAYGDYVRQKQDKRKAGELVAKMQQSYAAKRSGAEG